MQTPPRSYAYTSHLEEALEGNSLRSLPGSNGDSRLVTQRHSPSLTFPLRPLKSPKVRKPRSAPKTRSWFSGGYFRIQISASSSAKKLRSGSLFQRLPTAPDSVFALGWPIQQQQSAKDGCGLRSFNRLVREQSVPFFRQEALVRQGTQRALTTTENALIRRLSAEIMQLRSILALVYHPVHAVSGPPSTVMSIGHHQQESGLQLQTRTGHATPDSHRQKEFNRVLQKELETWLDVESKYRLTVEQVEATEGATHARDEYETWNTAFKDASRALADTLARLRRNTNSSAQTTSSQTREAEARTRVVYHPRHAVSDPPSTGSSVNCQVYRQEIGLDGHATPQAGGRTRALKLELERELNISLQKVWELESLIRNAKSSAETPSSQASAGGGQQSSFPAAVELDPSRAALKNKNEALSLQNNEHQIKPADLEQKDKESGRLSVELDQAKQESQQQLHSQLQSLLASKDKEIESYKSKEKEYENLKEKEYEALKKENDLLKKQVAVNEILKQKLTLPQEEYAHSESQVGVVVKELAAKDNIEHMTSEHALAALREELAQSKAELAQAKQVSISLQLTLQKERAEREQHAAQQQLDQDALKPSSDAATLLSSIRDSDTIFSERLQHELLQQQLNQAASHPDDNGCVGCKSVEDPKGDAAQPQTPIHPQNGENVVLGELLMEGGQLLQLLAQEDAEDASLLVQRPTSPIARALYDRLTEDAAQVQKQLESRALASKLADFIKQTEKMSLKDSFDVIARSYGEMSLFDLKTAIARVCNRITPFDTNKRIPRETVENLHKIMDTRGTGLVTKEDWCHFYMAQDSPNDLSYDIRFDSPHRDDPKNCEDISVSRSNHREVHRTKEACRLRTLQVISVAYCVQCIDILSLNVKDKEELTNADLKSMVQTFELDLTPEDVSDLFTDISSAEDYIKWPNMWKEAEKDATKLVEILTIIASALVWDIRSVSSAYLFLKTSGNDEGAPEALSTEKLVPDTISKEDLIQMNDAWQFCLSIQQVDLLFRYLDSSHNGNISLQSWLRAINPFCTAIKAMGRCLHHLVEVKKESDSERKGVAAGAEKLFQEFDGDGDGKLTLDEFKKSLEKKLPKLTYPEAHVKIFHTHLTYFTFSDSGAPSVLPSHWSAAFDLITCDEISSTNDMSYAQVLLETKRIIAREHFAALVISLCEKEAGVSETMLWMENLVLRTGEICLLKPSHLAGPLKDLKDLQWHLLSQHEDTPEIDSETESCPKFLASAVVGLCKKMAMRGAQLLVVLLASHKLSIDAAFTAFCVSKSEHITFDRFAKILKRLAPDFGNSSGRIGSLFLSFANSSKDKWSNALQQAAGHLRGKQFHQILLKDSTKASSHSENHFTDEQEAEKDLHISNGEREHLRNVFLGKHKHNQHSFLFINKDQLKESLAKMGCAMEEDSKTMDSGKTIYRQGRRRRGDTMAESSAEERMDNAEYTLWDFERKVEQSRLSSTFAQMKLHEIFGKALSVEMQPQKGICTPLAMEQLQSEHLMSWMLSLGKDRLEELIGRMYDLKRGDVIKMMVAAILDFHTKQESQTNINEFGNSKYSTWAGAFAGETKKACFGKLDDFKKGLDRHLGMPSFNVKQQMYREHCLSHDSHTIFSPPNNKDIKTSPAIEYDYVLNYDPAKEYPGGGDRTGGDIHDFMKNASAKAAGLTVEEAAALRLYSGPMYTPYNAVLRGGKKQFITTIHAIVSGIIKLASIMKLPSNRKLYRGLSGQELPEEFWNEDKYGARGGVEFGIMSTTTSKQVAIQYSSHGRGRVPTVFEIEIGQVDRGAVLKWISQFPGEEEVVLPPLSNLEVIGAPYLTRLEGKDSVSRQILVVPLRVNVNIKSKTMEELVSTRRDVLLSAIKDMQAQSEQDIGELAQAMGEIDALSNETEPEWFNDQVAHRRDNQERSSDAHNKEIMLRRRRKDLLELVTMRVGRPVTEIRHVGESKVDGPILNVRQITNKIISLEQQEWRRTAASEVSNRKRSSLSKQDECKLYMEKNALQLDLARKLCPDLKDVPSLSQKDDFFWQDLLNLCKKLVDALDSEVGVQFGALISDSFDQLAFQIRVEQTSDECFLAVGVFPEEVFKDGEYLKNEGCHSGVSPIMPGMDGGVAIAIRTSPSGGTKKNAGASKDGIKNFAKYLTMNANSESKEREGGSGDPQSFEDACLLDKNSNLYIVLDYLFWISEHNLISFHHDYFKTDGSVESRHIGNSQIDGSKRFHAAAVRLSGCSDCKVHIESVPKSTFFLRHFDNMTKAKAVEAVENLKKILHAEGMVYEEKRVKCSRGHSFSMLSACKDWRCDECSSVFKYNPRLRCDQCDFDLCSYCSEKNGKGVLRVKNSKFEKELQFKELEFMWAAFGSYDGSCIDDVAAVLCQPEHADKELRNAEDLKGKIAIVKSGVNEFFEKAQRAQIAGAVAAVIINTGRDASNMSDGRKIFRAWGASEEDSASAVTIPVLMVAADSAAATLLVQGGSLSQVTLVSKYTVLLELLDDVKSSDEKASGVISSADAIDKEEGLSGTFYNMLVKRIGKEWARIEFISMLVLWKKTSYVDIEGLKVKFTERADVIERCKSSLKLIYTAHTDCKAKEERKRENAQEQTVDSAQESILDFFKTLDRYGCVQAIHRFYPSKMTSEKKSNAEIIEIDKLFPQVKDIAYQLLEIVDNIVEYYFENSEEADYAFSLILENIDVLLDGISSSMLIFQQIAPEKKRSNKKLKSEDVRGINRDLTDAYDLGGISAKQSQAIARVTAAQDCFTRLDQVCTDDGLHQFESASLYHYDDLLWICNTSMGPELWLLDRNLYKAERENSPHHHAHRVLAWLNRQCVESELPRFVKHLDDASLHSLNFRRRFLAMLNTLEAACKVLPLTSSNCFMPTRRRFQSVKEELKQFLQQGADNMSDETSVWTRLKDGKARIKKRWNIGDGVGIRKRLESKSEDQIQKEKPQEECASTGNSGGQVQDFDNTLRLEFLRAEARYWEARTLLCSQELIRLNQNRQQKARHAACTRRSVMRCLELLDDTVYNFAPSSNEAAVRDSIGISINLQDTADEWEARLLGMLSLRHISCKLNKKSVVVGNMGTKSQSDNLHIGDLASGVQKELHLHEPDAKIAAFLASFLARASQDTVRVFLCDKIGNPLTLHESSSTESPPILLVPGGGLTAHISTDESGKKILDFSGKGLSVYSLRLLVEVARADEDVVQATIAGVDMDFSEEYYEQKIFARKTLFSEMSLQSNRFGEKDSVESMRIICDVISISASNLQTLNLSSNKINSAGAGILAKFLKQGARALKRLVLSDNLLENKGVEYLSKSIAKFGEQQGLEFLDVSKNKIEWEGALHLSEAISSQQCHVTDLNLAGNSFGSQGLVALAASLSCNRSIRSLNLSSNKIGDIGVDALAHKWPSEYALHFLTSLDLSENEITASGAGKLFGADFDKLAPKLADLSLSSNRISHTGIMKIATRLAACKNLDKLCLETQKPLNEVSEFNEHQLFVMGDGELPSDNGSITEQQAKFKVVLEIKLLCTTLLSEKKYALRVKNSKLEKEKELKCIRAAFGNYDGSSIDDVAAVLFDPEHADKELCNAEQLKGKVAVVRSGVNDFFEKAQRAQVAGAVAVVIINTDSTLFTASAGDDVPTSAVTIPVVMVAADSASTLLAQGVSRVTYAHTFPVMTSVLEGISLFCEADSSKSLSQEQIEKMKNGVEGKKQNAKKEWESNAVARSKAMKGLKDAWGKTGKPLSHLNRQDLSRKSTEALTGLVECAHTMRTKEPAYYLLDTNYTKALNQSLEVRRKCVDDFRKNLFASLLKPLRSMAGGKGNSKIILHTQGMENEAKGSLRKKSSFATLERSLRRAYLVDCERALEQHREAKHDGSNYLKMCAVKQSEDLENMLEVKNADEVKELKFMWADFGSYCSCIVDVATVMCDPEHAEEELRNAEQLREKVAVAITSCVNNNFEEKAQRAQNAGAVAVVIIDTSTEDLKKMFESLGLAELREEVCEALGAKCVKDFALVRDADIETLTWLTPRERQALEKGVKNWKMIFDGADGVRASAVTSKTIRVDASAVTIPVLMVAADSASQTLLAQGSRVTWPNARTVAFMILEQELKCRSLQHIVKFQRALKKKKAYQDAVEHAKQANRSAPVRVSLITGILQEKAAYKSMWHGKIADGRVEELAHLTLDALVQEKMGGLLPNDTKALHLLRAEDSKRKDEALEALKKEERHRAFEDVLEKLKQFADRSLDQERPLELSVEQLDKDHRKLLSDLCYSEYHLTCTEKQIRGHRTQGLDRPSFSSSFSDKRSVVNALVLDWKQKGEEHPKERLKTKEEVKYLFEKNPGFVAAWAASSELTSMWNVNDLSGSEYWTCVSSAKATYSKGSAEYWREVGRLVSSIPLKELSELVVSISKELDAMWLERWSERLPTQEQSSSTIFGSVYAQEGFGLCESSYHFVSETECYVSYTHTPDDWRLDDGSRLPAQKPFTGTSYDPVTRTFCGNIDWSPISRLGSQIWEYEMVFSDDFDTIRGGKMRKILLDGSPAQESRFPDDLSYCRANRLDFVKLEVKEFYTEHRSTVGRAYDLCKDLSTIWNQNCKDPRGLVNDEFKVKIGGEKGKLACFLELFRMLKKVVDVMAIVENDLELPKLNDKVLELIRADDSKRKDDALEALQKEPERHRALEDVLEKIEIFAKSAPVDKPLELSVDQLDKDHRKLVCDLCYSHYHLTCTEKQSEDDDGGEHTRQVEQSSSSSDKARCATLQVIDRKQKGEEHHKKHLATKEEVKNFFEKNPGFVAAWAASSELTSLWDVNSESGTYGMVHPKGSAEYWREVGRLVSSIPLKELSELVVSISKELDAMWLERWSERLPTQEQSSSTIFGSVYAQEGFGLCESSYHFVSETECYVSYTHTPDDWRLDDGSRLPAQKPFTGTSYDPVTRTFCGNIDWSPISRLGSQIWEYEMVFSDDFDTIRGGKMRKILLDGSPAQESRFPDDLSYCRANRLDFVKLEVKEFYTEHRSTVGRAYDLCKDLSTIWNQNCKDPRGLVNDEFKVKIGGEKGKLACFLELFRMLKKVVDVMKGFEEDSVKRNGIEAIIEEMRSFGSTNLPRLLKLLFTSSKGPRVELGDRVRLQDIHQSIRCDGCSMAPVRGNRYKCRVCPDFDFCEDCYLHEVHPDGHTFRLVPMPGKTPSPSSSTGNVVEDDHTSNPYKVLWDDGTQSDWLYPYEIYKIEKYSYFDEKADALLHHPVRLAHKRSEALRQHLGSSIEAIVKELRDYCSEDFPRLLKLLGKGSRIELGDSVRLTSTLSLTGKVVFDDHTSNPYKVQWDDGTLSGWMYPYEIEKIPTYFDEKAGPLLHHPVRLARKRAEAVRQHLAAAELFETTKEGLFCSPVLVSLLSEAVQHDEVLRQLQVLPRRLAFDTYVSECKDGLSLPVAIAANAPVINKTVSFNQHWHENPPEESRCYSVKKRLESSCLDSRQAWSPDFSAGSAWMEMDLGGIRSVAGVVTQCSYVRRIQNDQSVCKIEVEHRTRKEQDWVATELKCCECKGGDQKVEHVFTVPIEAQHVRIHIKECNGGFSIRAGVLESPRTNIQGEVVSEKSSQAQAGQCLVAFAPGVKWEEVGVKKPVRWCRRNHMLSMLSAGDQWRCDVCTTGPHTYNPRLRCDTCDFDVCKTCSSPAARLSQTGTEIGNEKPPTGTELGNEKLAAALRHKVEFSQQELDEFDMSNLTYASYIKVEDKYFQPAVLEMKWCKVDDLVDVQAAELASSLEDLFARELARLKDLYQVGGGAAKSKQALEKAVKKVRSRLEGELQTWDKSITTGTESEEKKEVERLFQKNEDWLKMVFDSSHCAHMKTFWNLDTDEPKGSICELDTHRWHFLRRFLKATDEAIERTKSICTENRPIQWEFLEEKSVQLMIWENGDDGLGFSPDKSVVESSRLVALGTPFTGGSISLQLLELEERHDVALAVGIALEEYVLSFSPQNEQVISVVLGPMGGLPFVRGNVKEDLMRKSKMGEGDTVQVDYDGKCVKFFVNQEVTPWFSVDNVTGQVRPIAIFLQGAGKVKVDGSARLTRKSLRLLCTKPQDVKEATACSSVRPCDLCVQEREKRVSDLLCRLASDLDTALRNCAQEAARKQHQKRALDLLRKELDMMCPTVSEEQDMDGRVEAALSGLPSALLAEPQCCQRMTAAVYCLAAAVHTLPLVRTDLPPGMRFLVPPFEQLPGTPHVLRCVEMLEMGTASRFQPSQRCKPYVWEASFPPRSVDLSRDSSRRVELSSEKNDSTITLITLSGESVARAEGTPVENGSFLLTLEEWVEGNEGNGYMGVSLEDYDIKNPMLSEGNKEKFICLTTDGEVLIQGETQRAPSSPLKRGDRISVKHDGKSVEIFVNDETRCGPVGVQGPVRPLVMNDNGKLTVRLSGGQMQAVKKQAVWLSMDQATESLPFQTILDLTPWEARVFGSLCVSPYKLTTPAGEVALQQLAAGELADVTLQSVDLTGPLAAFLAHFVARCCKEEVRVKIVLSGKNGDEHASSDFMLRPGGGLDGHFRKDASQKGTSATASGPSQDRVLVLSNMGVDVAALHLLMEAALAGLKEAAVPDRGSPEASKADCDKNEAASKIETSKRETARTHTQTHLTFEDLLQRSKTNLTTRLAENREMADGSRSLDRKRMVDSIELNQNPLIGKGKDLSMKLIVQIAHLTAGQCLLRLHLDNNNIEDEGIRALADAFTRNRFAPRLEILWLSMNRITDDSVHVFGDALKKSLHCLVDLSLFQNNFSTKGQALLRRKTAHKTSLTLRL